MRGPLFISMCYRCFIRLYLCHMLAMLYICFRGPLPRGPLNIPVKLPYGPKFWPDDSVTRSHSRPSGSGRFG